MKDRSQAILAAAGTVEAAVVAVEAAGALAAEAPGAAEVVRAEA